MADPHNKHTMIKIVTVGEPGSGASSLLKRLSPCSGHHCPLSPGLDFILHTLRLEEREDDLVRIQLWRAGNVNVGGRMGRVYFKETHGAFVLSDARNISDDDDDALEAMVKWKRVVDDMCPNSPIPVILLLTKTDLVDEENNESLTESLDAFCAEHGFLGWRRVSAKTNQGIDAALHDMASHAIPFMQSATRNPDPDESSDVLEERVICTLL